MYLASIIGCARGEAFAGSGATPGFAAYGARRTGQQCAQRWRHKVNPNIKKDKWTPEEDALLTQLVAEHGNRWAEIARHMDGRTDQQCMGRWTRHLDPNISR